MKFSRLGLIGDVHAESERLETALDFLRAAGAEQILCVGDICDGHGDVNRCCELLDRANLAVVRGNHDRWLLTSQMRDLPEATQLEELSEGAKLFLGSLPQTLQIETVLGPLLLCHGLGQNDMQHLTPDDYGYALEVNEELNLLIRQRQFRFVVGGHTHHHMVRHFGNLTVINAGTLHEGHEPCIAIADFKNSAVNFYPFNGLSMESMSESIPLSEF